MTYFYYGLLSFIQGFTEFLPISSSGHVAIFQFIFSLRELDELTLNLAVHGGTVLSILYVYRQSLFSFSKSFFRSSTLFWLMFFGTIPAAVIGFFLKKDIENLFSNFTVIGCAFTFTGFVLYVSEKLRPLEEKLEMTDLNQISKLSIKQAFFVGLSQALALVPGISRSGLTFSTGLLSDLSRSQSAMFSFMLAIPINLGAIGLQLFEWRQIETKILWAPLFFIFVASFAFGCLALKWILSVIRQGRLIWFAPYLFLIGLSLVAYAQINV